MIDLLAHSRRSLYVKPDGFSPPGAHFGGNLHALEITKPGGCAPLLFHLLSFVLGFLAYSIRDGLPSIGAWCSGAYYYSITSVD